MRRVLFSSALLLGTTAATLNVTGVTQAAAAAAAKAYMSSGKPLAGVNECDHYVAKWYGLANSNYHNALEHWNDIPAKHHLGGWEVGALAFWDSGDGHVAIGAEDSGKVYSTDWPSNLEMGETTPSAISSKWHKNFLGWTQPYFHGIVDAQSNSSHQRADQPGGTRVSDPCQQQSHTSTCISCAPFDADKCDCVHYARDRQNKLPGGLTTCADKTAKINFHSASAGCVMFRHGDPKYCHAAYVTSVSGGNVYFDQANWSPCKCSKDFLSTSSASIMGYWCP